MYVYIILVHGHVYVYVYMYVCMYVQTVAHLFQHRYARGERPETSKEQLTYHAAVLLEWSHGLYTTVIELALLNGNV